MEAVKLVAWCIGLSVLYGILHDQVTARICIEYFTIGHPTVIQTDSPTVIALVWGVLATWWVGLLLGGALAWGSLAGERPVVPASAHYRPVLILIGLMAAGALLAGITGYIAASNKWVILVGVIAEEVPEAKHVGFITDMWAHLAAYGVGIVGGLVLCVLTWRKRDRLQIEALRRQREAERAKPQGPLDE